MTEKSIFIAAALASGAILPLQALINARLGTTVGGPAVAAAISVGVGTLVLAVFIAVMRLPLPSISVVTTLPWWVWTGGMLGAFYVASVALTAPALGAASMVALVVLGQMLASLLLDHYGVLHAAQSISWQRLLGAVFLIFGVWLITRPNPLEGAGV